MKINALTLLLISTFVDTAGHAEAVKQWRDDAGKWHFGDSAAASGISQVDTVDYQARNVVVVKKPSENIYKKARQQSKPRKKSQKKSAVQKG